VTIAAKRDFAHPPSVVIAAVRTAELSAVIAGLIVYALVLWLLHRRFRQQVEILFSQSVFDEAARAEINRTLDEVNLDSAHFVFTMERCAKLLFRQQEITIAYGFVGTRAPGGIRGPEWTLRKTVFTLANNRQAEWMGRHQDVFTLAMSAAGHSVFWVKVDALVADHKPEII
jgi:hypothetical protein